MKNRKAGFTLIELLVVISIIAILTVAGIISFNKAGQSARDAKRKADLETVRQAMVQYRANREGTGGYPTGASGSFTDIVGVLYAADYLGTNDIKDPRDPSQSYSCESCTTTSFTLRATLERTGSTYDLKNP
ncbi:MAG: type II secretion system protein [Candidatus Pacebacteria bacterium]|nr:type II secretion system protein [Candidatus Paceibacterota bacterium]